MGGTKKQYPMIGDWIYTRRRRDGKRDRVLTTPRHSLGALAVHMSSGIIYAVSTTGYMLDGRQLGKAVGDYYTTPWENDHPSMWQAWAKRCLTLITWY